MTLFIVLLFEFPVPAILSELNFYCTLSSYSLLTEFLRAEFFVLLERSLHLTRKYDQSIK
jgi:hypothetical protein